MHSLQVLVEHVFVGEVLRAVVDWAGEAVGRLVDAVLVQGQAALPGKHLRRIC